MCADDDSYPISMRTMLRNNLTLKSGVTLDRRRVLSAANEFARDHPELLPAYVTHTFGVDEVQAAFELACRPTPERIKIAIVAMTHSRLQDALAAKERICGGWVVGPTIIGPEEFAAAGYDYVGFDLQHGYLDDADVALLLRRLEHVPIATAVRLPSADPAPIGRVLDAGADAVIVAMVESPEQAAAAVAADPLRARRGAQLRAAAGQPGSRSGRARGEGERVRDDRDRAGPCRRSTRSAPCPDWPGVYVGPGRSGDLAGSQSDRRA